MVNLGNPTQIKNEFGRGDISINQLFRGDSELTLIGFMLTLKICKK